MIFEYDEGEVDGSEVIPLLGWISFGVMFSDGEVAMKTIEKVADIMQDFVETDKIHQWFFLYEGDKLAVRAELKNSTRNKIKTTIQNRFTKSNILLQENSFCTYKEKKGKMYNEDVVETFANMMCWMTELWVKKRKFDINFSNYRFMERISHCMFNMMCGSFIHSVKDEKYFLMQRVLERSKSLFDDSFEDNDLSNIKLKKYHG